MGLVTVAQFVLMIAMIVLVAVAVVVLGLRDLREEARRYGGPRGGDPDD